MTGRSIRSTRRVARALFGISGRAVYRLALVAGVVLFFAAAICQPAVSAPINYGDFMGTTVTYTQVTEDANSVGDSPPLFGMPTVAGDALDFNPVGFSAASAGGVPDITDGQLSFGITAKPMNGITSISLGEGGDTLLAGFGTDATFTSVTAHGFLDIYDVDFVPLGTPILGLPFSMTFSPSGGTYGLLTDGGGGPIFSTTWTGSVTLNVGAILIANSKPFLKGATKVAINLDNTLTALSQANTQSVIAKKQFGGLTVTVNEPGEPFVPEPSTLVLAGIGLLGLFARRQGRNAA